MKNVKKILRMDVPKTIILVLAASATGSILTLGVNSVLNIASIPSLSSSVRSNAEEIESNTNRYEKLLTIVATKEDVETINKNVCKLFEIQTGIKGINCE